MMSFSAVAIGGTFRSLLRRKVTPSATHPGVKYVPLKVLNSTVLANFSWSARRTVSRVNGQRLATNKAALAITTNVNDAPSVIQRANTIGPPYRSIEKIDAPESTGIPSHVTDAIRRISTRPTG